MNNKIVAILSVALIGMLGIGSITTVSADETLDFNLQISVDHEHDAPYEQDEPIDLDGTVYNYGDDYAGDYRCQMWIQKLGGTYVASIYDQTHTGLNFGQQDHLTPIDWYPTEGGWYRVVGKVSFITGYDMDYSGWFFVRYN